MKIKNPLRIYDIREILTIRELIETSAFEFSDNTAFLIKKDGEVKNITYREAFSDMKALATYMNSLGLQGKKVAIIGNNSYQWALTYLAVCAGVGVVIPLDKELQPDELKYLLKISGTSAVMLSKEAESKIGELDPGLSVLRADDYDSDIERGNALIDGGDESYALHKIDPRGLGVLIYTSGTTGVAKGVMLSQYGICSNIVHVLRRVYLGPEDRALSVLPLNHTYECIAGFLSFIYAGASIAYNGSLRSLAADFQLYKPTVFVTVPLIVEKFHDKIMKEYASLHGGKAILGAQRNLSSLGGKTYKRHLFASVHRFFGGNLRAFLCGAAALSPEVFEDFEKFGFDVYNGYGLTETSPVCIMHTDDYRSKNDIGIPLIGVKVKLSDASETTGIGEITVKGDNVMLGYYENPGETARVIDSDGWFHTGDLAFVNDKGAYSIVGRSKNMIVTSNGKKIFPEEVEYYLNLNKYIAECMVYGRKNDKGDTEVGVSVYPDMEAVKAELLKQKITEDSPEFAGKLTELVAAAVKEANEKLPPFKAIRYTFIRDTEFEKTSTRKIKRFAESNIVK